MFYDWLVAFCENQAVGRHPHADSIGRLPCRERVPDLLQTKNLYASVAKKLLPTLSLKQI
jgi:hypothetical protein